MADVKILIAGSVRGNLEGLYKRVAAVNKSNGPFDLLLCTGDFFGDAQAAESNEQLLAYLQGSIEVPIQTYYLGASHLSPGSAVQILADSSTEGVGPQQRLVYLGASGVKTLAGLNIAYLDGPGSKEEVQNLQNILQRLSGDVDLLLTCPWPASITEGLPSAPLAPSGSEAAAGIALKARPRYHVASEGGLHFARAPYANKDLGAGSHVTRFIALGEVANASKHKWLHALKLQPAAQMAPQALNARPADTTDCPYLSKKRAREAEPEASASQSWRYDTGGGKRPHRGTPGVIKDEAATAFVGNLPFSANEDDLSSHLSQAGKVVDVRMPQQEGRSRGFAFVQFESPEAMHQACEALDGSELHKRQLALRPMESSHQAAAPAEAVPNCWFCLSNEQSDKRLVISVGEETYVAMDKGPINDFHVLILPIEHFPSGLAMPASAQVEAEAYLKALEACFAAQGKDTVSFERFLRFKKTGGNHAHVNVIAVPPEAGHRAETSFQEAATRHDIDLQRVPGPSKGDEARQSLRGLVKDTEYFVTTLPSGARLAQVVKGGDRHPLAFGREVLASLGGVPDRADWRACQGTAAEEEARAAKFAALFKQYDPMQAQ